MSAAEAVCLVTKDVVKGLLLNLPQSEILRARQVNSRWLAIIDGDRDLQEMLGRLPRATGELYCRRYQCLGAQLSRPEEIRMVAPDHLNPLVTDIIGDSIRYAATSMLRDESLRYGSYYRDYIYLSYPSCNYLTLTGIHKWRNERYSDQVYNEHGIDCATVDQAISRGQDLFGTDLRQWDFWISEMYQEGLDECHGCDCRRCQRVSHDQPGARHGRYRELGGYTFGIHRDDHEMIMR